MKWWTHWKKFCLASRDGSSSQGFSGVQATNNLVIRNHKTCTGEFEMKQCSSVTDSHVSIIAIGFIVAQQLVQFNQSINQWVNQSIFAILSLRLHAGCPAFHLSLLNLYSISGVQVYSCRVQLRCLCTCLCAALSGSVCLCMCHCVHPRADLCYSPSIVKGECWARSRPTGGY